MIFYDIDRQAQSINEWQAQHLKNLRQVTWQAQYINEWQAQYLGAATYFGHMFHQNVLQKDAPNIHACASPDGMGYNNTNRFVCLAFARSPKKTQVNISLYEWRGGRRFARLNFNGAHGQRCLRLGRLVSRDNREEWGCGIHVFWG